VGGDAVKAILDTNLLVSEEIVHEGYEVAVASLSWAELGFGVRKARTDVERARRKARIVRLRGRLGRGLPFDDAAADAYEVVCGMVLDNGRDVRGRVIDLMIAATAAANGAAVLTRNVSDFEGLEGLVEVFPA
jgi:predicted nucleic acid-binding protein